MDEKAKTRYEGRVPTHCGREESNLRMCIGPCRAMLESTNTNMNMIPALILTTTFFALTRPVLIQDRSGWSAALEMGQMGLSITSKLHKSAKLICKSGKQATRHVAKVALPDTVSIVSRVKKTKIWIRDLSTPHPMCASLTLSASSVLSSISVE